MMELFLKGGFIMYPLAAASIAALAIILERLWTFLMSREDTEQLFLKIKEQLPGDLKGAIKIAEQSRGPVAAVLHEALSTYQEAPAHVEERMVLRGDRELDRLKRRLGALSLIGTIAPMLGLLGTVTGMVKAFHQVAELTYQVSPKTLATGIWEALLTTVFGLAIAIPSLILYHFFRSWIEHLAFQMESYGRELLLTLMQNAEHPILLKRR